MKRSTTLAPLRIAGLYAVFGMAWIALSDRVLVWLDLNPRAMLMAQTWKGWVFVLASALLVYVLSRQTMRALRGRMEALRLSEERFRLLFGGNPMPMLVADPQTLRLLDANEAARVLFGGAPDAPLADLRDLVDPADRARFDQVFERYRAEGGEGAGRWRMQAKDGRRILADVLSRPMPLGHGEARLALVTDVSAQVAAESALLDATRQLERSTSELNELSHAAAHELQQPLRSVVSHLQALERRIPALDSAAREHFDFAIQGGLRMKSIVDDVLQITGMEAEPPAKVDMGQVLDGVLGVLRPELLGAEASVSTAPLPKITGRRHQMALLLHHLVDNAVKFRHPERPLELRLSARRDGDAWVFSVADNGVGIAPEHHLDVFGMFRRAHADQGVAGNGIGLAVCRKIVEQHGGDIEVASTPGEGATFTFRLPAT